MYMLIFLRCVLDYRWSKQQRARSHVIPSEQHPWPVETCFLFGNTSRYGWCRRYCWRIGLQVCEFETLRFDRAWTRLTSIRFQDKPGYRPGLYACIACCLLTLVIVALITLGSWRSNKKADRGEVELEYHDVRFPSVLHFCKPRILTSEQEGDQKGFRYTY
jgi:hypothetical protein